MIANKMTKIKTAKKSCSKRVTKSVTKKKARTQKNTQRQNKAKSTPTASNNDNVVNHTIKEITGSSFSETGRFFINQIISSMPEGVIDQEKMVNMAITMLLDMKPKDEIEGMLAVQMIAVHLNSMKMAYYSSVKKQDIIATNSSVNNMTKLMRTFVLQLEALQKYRGKCNQTIQVQHVQVNDGGQAVVGNIQGGSNG